MDNDLSRSCWWSQSSSDCCKDINSSPKLTSAFWKQLTEENDISDICIPSSQSTSPTVDKSYSFEYKTNTSSSLPQSKSSDFWQVLQSPSEAMNTHRKVLKDPWEQVIIPNQVSSDMKESLSSSLASSVIRQPGFNINRIPSIGDKENICSNAPRVIGSCKNESSFIASVQRDSKSPKSNLFPSYQDQTDGIWDTCKSTPFGNSFSVTSDEADSYGLNNSTSWVQIPTSLSQQQQLQDIGNINQPSLVEPPTVCFPHSFQASTDFTSLQEPSIPYRVSTQESHSGHGTAFHPQRQHTDLVALMQELSMVSTARDAGHLPYSGSMFQTYPHQKISAITQNSIKHCVFCKSNNYHSTFYKSHTLKDDHGHCQCPVLRMYVCPLCKATGDAAHTLKYCPQNAVTHGDPISAGLPPGKVISWREVADRLRGNYNKNY